MRILRFTVISVQGQAGATLTGRVANVPVNSILGWFEPAEENGRLIVMTRVGNFFTSDITAEELREALEDPR